MDLLTQKLDLLSTPIASFERFIVIDGLVDNLHH